MTQEELSRHCDYDRTYIGKIERGTKDPSMESIIRIAEVLDVSVHLLFRDGTSKLNQISTDQEKAYEENLYKKAFMNASHLILIVDTGWNILRINEAVTEFSGHTDRDLVGIPLLKSSLWQNFDESALVLKQGLEQASWGNLFTRDLSITSHDNKKHDGTCFISPVIKNNSDQDIELYNIECYL